MKLLFLQAMFDDYGTRGVFNADILFEMLRDRVQVRISLHHCDVVQTRAI